MSLSLLDLGWAAGFLEGEGSFVVCGRYGGTDRGIVLRAGQNEIEPLEKLKRLFGGHISQGADRHYSWGLTGHKAFGLAMTLWTLMGQRRRGQIEACIEHWKKRNTRKVLIS